MLAARKLAFLHVNTHAFAVSSVFDMALTRGPICRVGPTPSPYDKNSVLDKSAAGTMWMANEQGVHYSVRKVDMDGGFSWKLASGLATLQPKSGLAAVKLPGKPPALYMGTRDNDNFFTLDGGFEWGNPLNGRECGDCGPWFSDPAQPNRVLVFNRKCCGLENTLWSLYVAIRVIRRCPVPGSVPYCSATAAWDTATWSRRWQ